MNNQRLRNLTTKRLHTEMSDIYYDIEFLTGNSGIMTHQLPNALTAMLPWLQAKITNPRFWNGKYDPTHFGETEISPMTEEEQHDFFTKFNKLPSPFENFTKS